MVYFFKNVNKQLAAIGFAWHAAVRKFRQNCQRRQIPLKFFIHATTSLEKTTVVWLTAAIHSRRSRRTLLPKVCLQILAQWATHFLACTKQRCTPKLQKSPFKCEGSFRVQGFLLSFFLTFSLGLGKSLKSFHHFAWPVRVARC